MESVILLPSTIIENNSAPFSLGENLKWYFDQIYDLFIESNNNGSSRLKKECYWFI